ncbi:MAG: HAD family hydrolase [Paracoccaceae bacterium]
MTSKIKGILFDKDGTLYDFNATWAGWTVRFIRSLAGSEDTAAELAAVLGFDLGTQSFAADSIVIAGTPREIVRAIRRSFRAWSEADLLARVRLSSARTELVEAVPLAPLLDQLRAGGLVLGVATNDLQSVAEAHLAASCVADRFAFIAGCDSGYGAKPGTGMQEAFCRQSGLAREEVAMIGDSVHDLMSGRDAGMTTIGVLTGPAGRDTLAPYADAILADIGGLPGWLGLRPGAPNAT